MALMISHCVLFPVLSLCFTVSFLSFTEPLCQFESTRREKKIYIECHIIFLYFFSNFFSKGYWDSLHVYKPPLYTHSLMVSLIALDSCIVSFLRTIYTFSLFNATYLRGDPLGWRQLLTTTSTRDF